MKKSLRYFRHLNKKLSTIPKQSLSAWNVKFLQNFETVM